MTLRAYFRVLRERWLLILGFVIVTTAVAVVVTELTPDSYSADAQVLVSSAQSTDPSTQAQANLSVTYQVATYAKVIDSPDVVKYIQSDLHLGLSESALRGKLTASSETGVAIIDVTATDSSAARSASIATSAAKGLISAVEGYNNSVKLFLTHPADQPSSPSSPDAVLNILLGFLLGLIVGVAFAIIRDILDTHIKSAEELAAAAGVPVMGVIIDDVKAEKYPVAARAGQRNLRAENFRQLRANLQFANVDEHPRILAVTSSIPAEGKTLTSINLASTLAEAGFSVCLVDTDLRRPRIAEALGLPSAIGLTSVLIQQVGLREALQQVGPRLQVLASGPTPPNPSEVLASSYVRDIVRSLLGLVDYVILDTAPLLPVADGAEVAALADGTLLVARHGVTTESNVEQATAALQRVDASVLGVVLNRTPNKRNNRDYGYGYYTDKPTRAAQDDLVVPGDADVRGRSDAAADREGTLT